jgi:hypothetical protein
MAVCSQDGQLVTAGASLPPAMAQNMKMFLPDKNKHYNTSQKKFTQHQIHYNQQEAGSTHLS